MKPEMKIKQENKFKPTDPYATSLRALHIDIEEQIELARRHLEYLEKLRSDLEKLEGRAS